jgi:hypothetical protein
MVSDSNFSSGCQSKELQVKDQSLQRYSTSMDETITLYALAAAAAVAALPKLRRRLQL